MNIYKGMTSVAAEIIRRMYMGQRRGIKGAYARLWGVGNAKESDQIIKINNEPSDLVDSGICQDLCKAEIIGSLVGVWIRRPAQLYA